MEAQMAAQLQMQQAEGEVESEKAARDAESKEAAKPDRRASTPASQ
jgi:hypothetical protein